MRGTACVPGCVPAIRSAEAIGPKVGYLEGLRGIAAMQVVLGLTPLRGLSAWGYWAATLLAASGFERWVDRWAILVARRIGAR